MSSQKSPKTPPRVAPAHSDDTGAIPADGPVDHSIGKSPRGRGSLILICTGILGLALLVAARTIARPDSFETVHPISPVSSIDERSIKAGELQDGALLSTKKDSVFARADAGEVAATVGNKTAQERTAGALAWMGVKGHCNSKTTRSMDVMGIARVDEALAKPCGMAILALAGIGSAGQNANVGAKTAITKGDSRSARGANSPSGARPMSFSAGALASSMAPHPRLILDAGTLSLLRQRASAGEARWKALKSVCDSFIGGTVQYPTGDAYPDRPDIGQGYQGSDYVPALLSEGMCYQVLKSAHPAAAAPYGAKAVDILLKMSESGGEGQDPCTDSGYGIRFYGVGFGLGYDWTYELLTAAQRTQVYTTANGWIAAWEKPGGCADFEYEHPQSNYFAGYFHAKAVISLATYDENPSAPAQWDDWLNNQFAKRVQPYYQQHLAGGGWPEGYANYAPLGILNMSLPAREVKTATGLDLVHASAPYLFPLDNADYAMHFTWPSRAYSDDRDTNHSNSSTLPPGTTQVGMFQQILGALSYWKAAETPVFRQYLSEVDVATSGFGEADAWQRFLAEDPDGEVKPVSTLPRSYLAPGLGAVAARSDWGTTASWMSFRAAPYANNPGQGEEYFDQGSLALVRGATPLLVNAGGWAVHDPNGTAAENEVYNDNFSSFNANNVYLGNRQSSNIYYVRNMQGGAVAEQFGQAAFTLEDNQVSTKIAAYEDGGDYVYVLATGLEDMYRRFAAGAAVANWSRQIVYLRPHRFVVYDRTTEGSSSYDQYLAWHFPASPIANPTSGSPRVDVTFEGKYAGAMTTVLPLNASMATTAPYPTSDPVKVWQVQVRAADTSIGQQWLTVFDLSPTAAAVATAKPVIVNQGAILGVALSASDGNTVMISSTGAAGVPITGTIGYTKAASAAHHVVTGLRRNTGYGVTVTTNGNVQNIGVSIGSGHMSSAGGVLSFFIDAAGGVKPAPPPASTLPVSTLPVSGHPRPNNP